MTGYARLTIVALTESVLPSETWGNNQWWNHYRTGMCMHCRLKKYLLLSRLVVAWSDKNIVKSEISAWWSQNIDSASPNTQHYSQFFIWFTSKFRLLSCLPIFKNGTTPHIWMTYTYTMSYKPMTSLMIIQAFEGAVLGTALDKRFISWWNDF